MKRLLWIRFFGSQSDNLKSKIENLKLAGVVTLVVQLAMGGAVVLAQQPTKVSQIGYLGLSFPSANVARIEALRQGLRDLGYVEGKNIVFEWRWAEGKPDRIPGLAAELVKLKVDVIVTQGLRSTALPKKQRRPFPSSWVSIATRLEMVLSLVLHDPAGT